MTIGKRILTVVAVSAAVLIVFAGCDWNIYILGGDDNTGPEPGIYFSLEWTENSTDEPHLYVTYPAPADGNTTDDAEDALGGPPIFYEPNLEATYVSGDAGFEPADQIQGIPDELSSGDVRGAVYYGNNESVRPFSGDAALEYLGSDDGNEEIILREFPFYSDTFTYNTEADGTADDLTMLPVGDYAWVGVMQVYAFATSGQLSYADGDGVGAVLTIYEVTSSGNENILGVYEVPGNTDTIGTSLVRVNCFYNDSGQEIYQFAQDGRPLSSTTQIRSVMPAAEAPSDAVVTVARPADR